VEQCPTEHLVGNHVANELRHKNGLRRFLLRDPGEGHTSTERGTSIMAYSRPKDVPEDRDARIEAALGRVVELRQENASLRRRLVDESPRQGGTVVPFRPRKGAR
jgi:hypothetical protein